MILLKGEWTPLLYACFKWSEFIMSKEIALTYTYYTPVHETTESTFYELNFKRLINGSCINDCKDGVSALHFAVLYGNAEAIYLLLKNGINTALTTEVNSIINIILFVRNCLIIYNYNITISLFRVEEQL